jgi:hypothetical protein
MVGVPHCHAEESHKAMAPRTDREALALWRFLDLVLYAYALSCDIDADVANFAMLAALAVGDRLALSENAVRMMRDSAVAEARRQRHDNGTPCCSDADD